MNSSIYRFTLGMNSSQSQISIPVMLGDTGREWHINLSDGGKPYIIADGCLAMLSIKRPTGPRLEEFCAIEDNTTIVYKFTQNENTCIVEGIHECDITLYGLDGKAIATARFTMVVSERAVPRDDIVITDEDYTAVDAMLSAEAVRQAKEIERQVAEEERVTQDAQRAKELAALLEKVRSLTNVKIGEVTLTAAGWVAVQDAENLYAQVVEIDGVTEYSQVDLTPSVEQLAVFYNKDLAFVTENEDGVVTVYAIGQRPQNDYTIQVTITEVNV